MEYKKQIFLKIDIGLLKVNIINFMVLIVICIIGIYYNYDFDVPEIIAIILRMVIYILSILTFIKCVIGILFFMNGCIKRIIKIRIKPIELTFIIPILYTIVVFFIVSDFKIDIDCVRRIDNYLLTKLYYIGIADIIAKIYFIIMGIGILLWSAYWDFNKLYKNNNKTVLVINTLSPLFAMFYLYIVMFWLTFD